MFRALKCFLPHNRGDDVPKLVICLITTASFFLFGCSQESQQTEEEQLCTARLYPSHNPKNLDQCLNVCRACRGGTPVTCSTSCKLRGRAENSASEFQRMLGDANMAADRENRCNYVR